MYPNVQIIISRYKLKIIYKPITTSTLSCMYVYMLLSFFKTSNTNYIFYYFSFTSFQ